MSLRTVATKNFSKPRVGASSTSVVGHALMTNAQFRMRQRMISEPPTLLRRVASRSSGIALISKWSMETQARRRRSSQRECRRKTRLRNQPDLRRRPPHQETLAAEILVHQSRIAVRNGVIVALVLFIAMRNQLGKGAVVAQSLNLNQSLSLNQSRSQNLSLNLNPSSANPLAAVVRMNGVARIVMLHGAAKKATMAYAHLHFALGDRRLH